MLRARLQKINALTLVNLISGFTFLLLSIVLVVSVNTSYRSAALKEAEAAASIILNRNLATHHYFNNSLKPDLFQHGGASSSKDYFDPIWMSSTYAVREIEKIFREERGYLDYYYKEAAINARNPQNEADDFERNFLVSLNQDDALTQKTEVRDFQGKPYFVILLRGEAMEQGCLACHGDPKDAPQELIETYGPTRSFFREVGTTVSVVSIRIPLAVAYQSANRNSLVLGGFLLAALVFLYLFHLWMLKKVVFVPIDRIRDHAVRIASNEEVLGEQIAIPIGAELKELTDAYNSMSLKLRDQVDDLESHIEQRTLELQKSQRLVEKILNTTPNLLYVMDFQSKRFVFTNKELLSYLGYPATAWTQDGIAYWRKIIHPDDLPTYEALISAVLTSDNDAVMESEYRVQKADGEWRWLHFRGVVFQRDTDSNPVQVLCSGQDVTYRKQEEERLLKMSTQDALTGMHNRMYFDKALDQLEKSGIRPVCVISIDVDNLKKANDTDGHAAGDELLRCAGLVLRSVLRVEDVLARYGGDEFTILLPGAGLEAGQRVVERIRKEVDRRNSENHTPPLSLSIGLAVVEEQDTIAGAMRRADRSMYQDKFARKSV